MADIVTMLIPAAAPLLWLLISFAVLVRLARYRKRKLLRCPESGGIALVNIEEVPLANKPGSGAFFLKVKNCQLWPERKECGTGCLTRFTPTWASYGFDLVSLRPFEDYKSRGKQ